MNSPWIQFGVSAFFIIVAGVRLTRYADLFSEKSRIGKAWVGIVLLGVVTSLPEAGASLVSIISLSANDLAVGNILGSNIFNPLMIVVMDIIYRQGSITNTIKPNLAHKNAAMYSIFLSTIVILDLTLGRYVSFISFGNASLGTIGIILVYIFGIRHLSGLEIRSADADGVESPEISISYQKIWINIVCSAAVVILAAVWLANACDTIAHATGLGYTFVGSVFLALVTSLPEMVVVISALRLGSTDLAIGNLFGSNMVNIFLLAVCGLFSQTGPILWDASLTHIFVASLGIALTYLGWIGIQFENKKTFLGLGIDSIIMILIFAVGMNILYVIR